MFRLGLFPPLPTLLWKVKCPESGLAPASVLRSLQGRGQMGTCPSAKLWVGAQDFTFPVHFCFPLGRLQTQAGEPGACCKDLTFGSVFLLDLLGLPLFQSGKRKVTLLAWYHGEAPQVQGMSLFDSLSYTVITHFSQRLVWGLSKDSSFFLFCLLLKSLLSYCGLPFFPGWRRGLETGKTETWGATSRKLILNEVYFDANFVCVYLWMVPDQFAPG